MSYTKEREQFLVHVTAEGMPYQAACTLLRCATTINRLAELSCSSEAADRDRIPCPRKTAERMGYSTKPLATATRLAGMFPCLCDRPNNGHEDIPRIRLHDYRAEERARKVLPEGWQLLTSGDPRGFTLRIIPPSYAQRNEGKDRHNLESIGVPARDSGLKW